MDGRSINGMSSKPGTGSAFRSEAVTAATAASGVPVTTTTTSTTTAATTVVRKKKPRKKRRTPEDGAEDTGGTKSPTLLTKEAKLKKKRSAKEAKEAKEKRKERRLAAQQNAQQMAVQEQMRRALEDDRYSALGSIVSGTDSENEQELLQPSDIRAAMRKRLWTLERRGKKTLGGTTSDSEGETESVKSSGSSGSSARRGRKKKRKQSRGSQERGMENGDATDVLDLGSSLQSKIRTIERGLSANAATDKDEDSYEEGSIFGPTTGSTQTTWVECDKCKKWRRLRGVVDESKLPSRWYCSMNKNDPERARCSAPEEEYSETPKPEENAAEKRVRKHLRVWIRRLETQEAFRNARRPITRGTKRTTSGNSKEPYLWVQCHACGKWRAGLPHMDKSQLLLDRTAEWYCVMNTWDEKMASCAAPQENLPAIGCPSWVLQDES